MLPIRTILHPTDFSEGSAYAFRLAYAVARDSHARLILLHVFTPPMLISGEALLPPDPEVLKVELRLQLQALKVEDGCIQVERRLEEGYPGSDIPRVARETKADLIVMGTHGRTGLGRLLMGSVAEQVMRKAPCPVLTVKVPLAEERPSEEAAPVMDNEAVAAAKR